MVLVPNAYSAVPYNAANPTPVIMYAHGMGEDQTGLLTDSLKATVVTALLNAGYILAGTNAHGANWGNQAGVNDYAALDQYLRLNYNVSNVCIWSQSMGGCAGLLALAQNKVRGVVGWLGTYPVCSLSAAYTGTGNANFSTSITTAFGITGSGIYTYTNQTYGNDPLIKNAIAFRNVPMRFYASPSDTYVLKSANTDLLHALVVGSCRESTIVVCTGDHGDPSHFDATSYTAFFARCFANAVPTTGSPFDQPAATKTVTITLVTTANSPQANLTSLKWAFFDQATPSSFDHPTDYGSTETTDGSGVLVITVHTTLSAGGIGWLTVTNSDGTTSQSPAHKAFSGPVVVA
jgi:hypothetical protein